MEKIVLFGNGQVASHAYYNFTHDSPYQVAAFTVDREFLQEDTLFGLPVVPFEEVQDLYPPDRYGMYVSISFRQVNRLRAEKYAQAKARGYRLVNMISSRAAIYPDLCLGDNVSIGANAVISPYTEIGSDVVIAAGCVVGHHTKIGDHCFLSAGVVVSGSVVIEDYAFLGSNATIRDRVKVAESTVVGAGANILEDTVPRGVYLARPADRLPLTSDQLPLG